MVSRSAVVFFLLAAIATVSATNVNQCEGRSIENLSSKVQLSPCKKTPCKLKKNTNQQISIEFVLENKIKDLTNRVSANVFGADLPFIGVNGNSVCEKIYKESGEKANCPLDAGTYVYKDSFPVLAYYPKIAVNIQWKLSDPKDNDIICFKVPAKIVD